MKGLVKRSLVTIAGVAVTALGVVLMVLPGPGILLIVAGLAILATEYVWARRLVTGARRKADEAQRAAVASPRKLATTLLGALGLIAVGVLMLVVDDVAWPVLNDLLDRLWTPVAGGILVVSGCIVLTTTYIAWRAGRGEDTTYLRAPEGSHGATRVRPQ